ncbi:MAG: hypothetical protein PF447_07100 [Spirochaetaceae bacterium]|jgi:competence protein ComGC|nr:hypothetical protein [Spirochaetaceae bacterium]
MQKKIISALLILVVISLSSCGIKRKMAEKVASAVENQAREMGLDVDMNAGALQDGLVQGLAGEALEDGAKQWGESLTDALSEENVAEITDALAGLDGMIERDEDGEVVNLHFQDETGQVNLDGSTPWPEEMPGKIPEYTKGMIITYQLEPEESITVIVADTTREEALDYLAKIKPFFEAVYDNPGEEYVFVGKSSSDGILFSHSDSAVVIQYYLDKDFMETWEE